MHSNGLI